MRVPLEKLANAALILCAVLLAALAARREFLGPARGEAPGRHTQPIYHENWTRLLEFGTTLGDPTAPVHLIEFSDIQCPFCARFHATVLPRIRDEFGDQVALTFLHFPLTIHPSAVPAAIAAECAKREQRFGEMLETLFEGQDSLGLKSWPSFAEAAGIRDVAAFERCLDDSAVGQRVEASRDLAVSLGIRGTPGILLNGWYFPGGISQTKLQHSIRRTIAGESIIDD